MAANDRGKPRICVFGAGSIGCYVGGRLQAAGASVRFIGRARLAQEAAEHGLHLTDYRGAEMQVPAGAVDFETDSQVAADADLVLVTVKSAATAEAGRELADVLKPGTAVISFQNGLGHDVTLRTALPDAIVLAGMVQFNVVARGSGAFHQATEGALAVTQHASLQPFAADFAQAGLPLQQHTDMAAVQWAKLLLNLNNAINALSDLPIKEELSQRSYRRCLVLAQREALGLLDAAGIRPAKLTSVPPHWMPHVLALPDALFRRVANAMIAIDPSARGSMWYDLHAGRLTEVDWLNGEVVRLAKTLDRVAPVNARLATLVHAVEQGGRRDWPGEELLMQLRQAALPVGAT